MRLNNWEVGHIQLILQDVLKAADMLRHEKEKLAEDTLIRLADQFCEESMYQNLQRWSMDFKSLYNRNVPIIAEGESNVP